MRAPTLCFSALLGASSLLLACGTSGSSGTTETEAQGGTAEQAAADREATTGQPASASDMRTPRVPGYFDAEGAPHPLVCTEDADCAYGGILADNGCCWSFRDANAAPMSVLYKDWGMRRRTACEDDCPPPPVPTQPPGCLFQVRCEAELCVNACP